MKAWEEISVNEKFIPPEIKNDLGSSYNILEKL